jgi:hypothetical protein
MKTPPSKKGWPKIMLAVTIVAGFVWLAGHWLRAPVTGRSIPARDFMPAKTAPAKPGPKLDAGTLESAYFQLAVPAGYSVRPAGQPAAGLLYQQTLIKPSASGSIIIAIAVKPLPEGGASQDSSFALRAGHPERYSFSSRTIGGETVSIAADSQSTDVAAFWPHSSYLAVFGVSSGVSTPGDYDPAVELAALRPLLDGWRWR